MDDRRRLALIVGVFVIVALGFAAASLLTLGSRRGLLNPQYRLVTYFDNVQGLTSGAPVRLAGKDVGTVEFVTFAPLSAELPAVRVVMRIDRAVQKRIRSDSVASIGTIGLLGDRYVEVQMGTAEGRVLEDGDQLASVTPLDYTAALERGARAVDSVATLAENVNRVVEEFRDAMGGRRVAETVAGLSDLTHQVQEGDGLLHSLIYDSYEGSGVESIEASLATLEEILDEVAHGDGFLHRVIYEPAGAVDPFSEVARASERLRSVLEKVDRGEGTLGLLVNDPSLYEDLRLLVGGARRSFVVRSLIRMSTEKPEE